MNTIARTYKKISAGAAVFLAAPFTALAQGLVPCNGPDCNLDAFLGLIENVMNFAITIAPFLAAIAFAFAGFYYFTSAGDTSKVERAHDIFKSTAIGLVIILAAWFVVKAILVGLGVGPEFNFLQ